MCDIVRLSNRHKQIRSNSHISGRIYHAELLCKCLVQTPGLSETIRPWPVSYTPLAVYKRKTRNSPVKYCAPSANWPMSNETITLVKDTSLIYVLAMNDLLRAARGIVQRDFTTTPFFVAAAFYLVMTCLLYTSRCV